MKRVSFADLKAVENLRPAGYRDAIVSAAKFRTGKYAWIADEDWSVLAARFGAPVEPSSEPSMAQMAGNLTGALMEWAAAGFPVAAQDVVQRRREACQACRLWDADARAGMGKCGSPKCGCTGIKWWLATSVCPERKWV